MKSFQKTLLAISISSVSYYANADESSGYITESGIEITPIFETKLEHNDNVGRYSSSEKLDSSNSLIVSPGILLESNRAGNQYSIGYLLSSGSYFSSHKDDYLDHAFTTNNFVQFNRRVGLGLNYTYLYGHEARGTGVLAGSQLSEMASEPVKYGLHNVNTTFVYGADNAQGKIESQIRYENKTYKNYRDFVIFEDPESGTKYKDYHELGGSIAFYYQFMPATKLLFEIDVTDRQYRLSSPSSGESQDNLNTYYLIGAQWDITGKTTGKLRLGLQDKNYEAESLENFDGFSWDLNFSWKPVNHSEFQFSTSQIAEDPEQGTNYMKQTQFDVGWKHFWLTYLYSNISLSYSEEDYSESIRRDELYNTSFLVGYELSEHIEIRGGWAYENNKSTIESNRYTQNIWFLSANLIF